MEFMKFNKWQNILIALNSAIGIKITLDEIYSLLGIIILSIQLILIIIQAYAKIKDKLAKNDVDGVVDDVNNTIQQIEQLKPTKKDGEGHGKQ